MIKRILERELYRVQRRKKAIIILGARQTGKTTLMKNFAATHQPFLWLNCDDPAIREQLENANMELLRFMTRDYDYILIDEAQRVNNIGLVLKMLTDELPEKQLLVTGSSSFELSSEINEPLTGRKREYHLYPVSWEELANHLTYLNAFSQLDLRLVYGMYPEVVNHPGEEEDTLKEIADSYLYKDLLSYKGIRRPDILEKLLKALALQIGSEVSYNEVASLVGIDKNTVLNYIELLEKSFVIFRLHSFHRNLRNEINTGKKIYFCDNGIRNALLNNYNLPHQRTDIGALWENFMVSERMKYLSYHRLNTNVYFWRTHTQQEIDYVEERNGKITGYEIKYSPRKKARFPKSFVDTYQADISVIHKENFHSFLMPAEER